MIVRSLLAAAVSIEIVESDRSPKPWGSPAAALIQLRARPKNPIQTDAEAVLKRPGPGNDIAI